MYKDKWIEELQFKAVRSSGAGGQHVNKVSSKVILYWSLSQTTKLTEEEKELVLLKLKNRINKEGVLILECDTSRSQIKNKEIVVNRFIRLIEQSIKKEKPRRLTKIPKGVLRKRKEAKQKLSLKKVLRKRWDY